MHTHSARALDIGSIISLEEPTSDLFHCIGFGAWAIGGDWGNVDDGVIHGGHACGDIRRPAVNFVDTAGCPPRARPQRAPGRAAPEGAPGRHDRRGGLKAGRRVLPKQLGPRYPVVNLTEWVNRSLRSLKPDPIEPSQPHGPPAALYEERRRLRHPRRSGARPASFATTASAWRRRTKRWRPCAIRACRASRSSSTCSG